MRALPIFLVLFAISCASSSRNAEPIHASPSARTTYYHGWAMEIDAADKVTRRYQTLLMHRVDPTEELIEQRLVQYDPARAAYEESLTYGVYGNQMSAWDNRLYTSVQGELDGVPWHWTDWRARHERADGSAIRVDAIQTTDGLHYERLHLDPRGRPSRRVVADLEPISSNDFRSRLAVALAGAPAMADASGSPARKGAGRRSAARNDRGKARPRKRGDVAKATPKPKSKRTPKRRPKKRKPKTTAAKPKTTAAKPAASDEASTAASRRAAAARKKATTESRPESTKKKEDASKPAKAAKPAAKKKEPAPPPEPVHEETWYAGESRMALGDGTPQAKKDVLLHRVVDERESRIEIHTVRLDPSGESEPVDMLVTMFVEGNRYTMRQGRTPIPGEGRLVGPAWHWTSWRATSRLPGGRRAENVDRIVGSRLVSVRKIFEKDGTLLLTFSEELEPLGRDEWRRRMNALRDASR